MNLLLSLLREYERQPGRLFTERTLREADAVGFDEARVDGWLSLAHARVEFVDHAEGRRRVLYEHDRAVLIDEDEVESPYLSWSHDDTRVWRIDLDAVVRLLRRENGLAGPCGQVGPRLWLCGAIDDVPIVLAFWINESMASQDVVEMASLLPGSPSEFVIACPQFTPSIAMRRDGERHGCRIIPLDDLSPQLVLPPVQVRPSDDPSLFDEWLGGLTPGQRAVVHVLRIAREFGQGPVRWADLKAAADGAGINPTRMNDVFRHDEHWRRFIEMPTNGYWRLSAT